MSVAQRSARVKSTLVHHIARVDLRVRDIDRSLGFYRDVVGLEVEVQSPTRVSLRSSGGPVFLTLDSEGVEHPADPQASGLFHIAIRFPTKAALGDALARLVSAGMEIGAGDHAVSEALYIDDPDGNGVELYYDRPTDQWPAPTEDMMVPMITAAVDLHALLAEGSGEAAVGQRAAEGTDMGHVHLQVADVDEAVSFYEAALGLDLTARMGSSAAFFSSNGYHHNIGANSWRSRGGKPARQDGAGLTRIVFEVRDSAELEAARARLDEQGYETSGATGRDVVVSDPAGIELVLALG